MTSTSLWKVLKLKTDVRTIIALHFPFLTLFPIIFTDLAGFLKTNSAKFAAIGVDIGPKCRSFVSDHDKPGSHTCKEKGLEK